MSVATLQSARWLPSVTQLLDEHHLVVLSDHPMARLAFSQALATRLGSLAETQVIRLAGAGITDTAGFCHRLGQALGMASRKPPNLGRIIETLRQASPGVRRRYLVWNDADEMLERGVARFARVVAALMAVAVEHEYFGPEPLVLQRVVLTGGAKLGAYAEDERGPFCCWPEEESFASNESSIRSDPSAAYPLTRMLNRVSSSRSASQAMIQSPFPPMARAGFFCCPVRETLITGQGSGGRHRGKESQPRVSEVGSGPQTPPPGGGGGSPL